MTKLGDKTVPPVGTHVVVSPDAHMTFAKLGDKTVRLEQHDDGTWFTTANGQGCVCIVKDTRGVDCVRGQTIIVGQPFSDRGHPDGPRGVFAQLSEEKK